jgi:hypothetical protein
MTRREFMDKKKIIIIDEQIDLLLTNICDAALKASGMEALKDVNALAAAVVDEQINEHDYI